MDFMRRNLLALGILIALTVLVIASLVELPGDPRNDDLIAGESSADTPHTFMAASELSPRETDHLPHEIIVTEAGSGSRSPEATYVGIANCKGCHGPGGIGGDKWSGWNETNHGKDFTHYEIDGQIVNKITIVEDGEICATCHVVGYDQTDIGGYDPNQEWNSSHNIKLIGIQCESCHGPGSEHNGNPAGIIGAPTVKQSCYGTADAGCHGPAGDDDMYSTWNESKHARSQDKSFVAGNPSCAQCHSREIFSKEMEGEEHEGEVGTNPVDCALCHDPHDATNEAQLRLPEEELCVQCHTTETGGETNPGHTVHHPQAEMNQGLAGFEVLGGVGMAGVECVDCHMYSTPDVVEDVPVTDVIGGEEHDSHTWEPTAWACANCHSNTINNMPNEIKPQNSEGDNESLWNEWEDFESEWGTEVEKWDGVIEAWQGSTQGMLDGVELLLAEVDANITSAQENGTVSAEKLVEIWEIYNESLWNYQMVNADGSRGVHNFDFAVALLADANLKANEAERLLAMALTPKENVPPIAVAGTSKLGKLDDTYAFDASNAVDKDGTIVSYEWDFGDGTQATGVSPAHKYTAIGQYVVTLTVTDDDGAVDSDVISVFVVEDVPDLTGLEQKTADLDQKTNELDNELAVKADKDDLSSKVGTGGLIVVLVVALVAVGASFMMVKQELDDLKRVLKHNRSDMMDKGPKEEN